MQLLRVWTWISWILLVVKTKFHYVSLAFMCFNNSLFWHGEVQRSSTCLRVPEFERETCAKLLEARTESPVERLKGGEAIPMHYMQHFAIDYRVNFKHSAE